MDATKTIAALFDFDGVIMDTEPQYTIFGMNRDKSICIKRILVPE